MPDFAVFILAQCVLLPAGYLLVIGVFAFTDKFWYFSLILGFIKNGDKWRRLLEKVGVWGVGLGENKISKYWVFRPVFGCGDRSFLKFLRNS